MLLLIRDRLSKVNCSPDCNLGFRIYINQQVAFCYHFSLYKQQKQVNLEKSKPSRSNLCMDRLC